MCNILRVASMFVLLKRNESRHEKTNNVVFEQARQKPTAVRRIRGSEAGIFLFRK